MNGMESVRDLLDGGQRASAAAERSREVASLPYLTAPSAAHYAPPADHEEPSP